MNRNRTIPTVVALALLIAFGCVRRQADTPATGQASQGPLVSDQRFLGEVRLQTPSGPESVRVVITNVDIRGRHKIDRLELPFEGTLMAYLQAGELTTTIHDRPQARSQGQIWTVPPGVPMGLATGRDAASLQTVLVGK